MNKTLSRIFRGVAVLLLAHAWIPPAQGQLAKSKIKMVDGSTVEGSIQSIDALGKVTGDLPTGTAIDQVLRIETDVKIQPAQYAEQIHLVGGGFFGANKVKLDNDKLSFESSIGLKEIPLETVRGIVWKPSPEVTKSLANPSSNDDRILAMVDGTIAWEEGLLEKVVDGKVHMQFEGQSQTVSIDIMAAIVVADLKLSPPRGSSVRVKLSDGSLINGAIGELSKTQLQIKLAGGNSISLRPEQVCSIEIQSDRLAYLSDMTPTDVREKVMFTLQRGWKADRSVEGNPLTLNTSQSNEPLTFNKGIGTQAFSQIEFENKSDFTHFRAMVGIDSETQGRGDCIMTVQGDGIELWSKRIRAGDDPQSVVVPIKGLKKVALVVQAGELFDLGDHANWCNARMTK